MTVHFLDVARWELSEAMAYYETQGPSLGKTFMVEFLASVDRIRRYPEAFPSLGQNTRRCRLRRFPYGIIYQADGAEILILAIAHMHRRPGYWRDRTILSD